MSVFDGLSEFKFYQSFRIPVEKADNLRFLVEKDISVGKNEYIEDGQLIDLSMTGLGFKSKERISVGTDLVISLQYRKLHLDLSGTIVRSFSNALEDEDIIYGVQLDEEPKLKKFLEYFVSGFTPDRSKHCIIESALNNQYSEVSDGIETFSLLLSLFKDISLIGGKEGFVESLLEEVCRVMNASRATIFLINVETNELEAVAAMGVEKLNLHFDYRLGIAGSVFTTGVALNIDVKNDKSRFNPTFDKKLNFQTRSIICHPIHNREDKIVGVIQVLNKKNEDRFTVEDEKIMKVLTLVFSSVYHNFTPLSEKSIIRRFSTPYNRRDVIIGKTHHVTSLRSSIIKLKDIDTPVLILGESGVGKRLLAKIIHGEGQRGLNTIESIDCSNPDIETLEKEIWGNEWGVDDKDSKLIKCRKGTLIFSDIDTLPVELQSKLFEILEEKGIPGSKYSLDVRFIFTSKNDPGGLVEDGLFHKGLYRYISSALISLEPLRRRVDDIPLLIDYYVKLECKEQGLLLKSFTQKVMDQFQEYDWPGNVTELKAAVKRAVLYNPKAHVISEIELENNAIPILDISAKKRVFGEIPHISDFRLPLKDRVALAEREMILQEIKRNNGNKSKAAKEMGISREALRKKLLTSDEILENLYSDDTEEDNAA